MIVDFHFDEDFLGCDALTAKSSNLSNATLLKFWYERGCLVYPASNLTNYKDWIEYVPAKFRNQWLLALSANLTVNMSNGYKKINDYTELSALERQCVDFDIDLVLVTERFSKFGINDNSSTISAGFDLCKFDDFLDTPSVINSYSLERKGILPGDNIDNIWNAQFRKLAKHSKVITIIDRYFGKNICDDINKRRTSLEKLVILLGQERKKYNITIFTVGDVKNSSTHVELENYIRSFVKKANIASVLSSINVCSCHDNIFRDHAHERFISFDNFVVTIDRGMEIFRDFSQSATSINIQRKNVQSNFSHALKHLQANRIWSY